MRRTFAWGLLLATLSGRVPVSAQPTITTEPRTQFAWEGKRVSLSVRALGTGNFTYQWQRDSIDIDSATNRTFNLPSAQRSDTAVYRVLVTDSTGMRWSEPAPVVVRAWPRPTGPQVELLKRLDADMQSVLVNRGIPGGALAVAKDGKLVFARGYGWADAEKDAPFQPDSSFPLASLTKTITAVTVLRLVEEEKLSLTNQVLPLLRVDPPTYPGAALDPRMGRVTIRQVLNHTGGWVNSRTPSPLGGNGFDPCFWPELTMKEMSLSEPATPSEFVQWMLGRPLDAEPGTVAAYSSAGYLMAGRVVESLTGQSFVSAASQLMARAGITRIRLGHNARNDRFHGEALCYLHPSITPSDVTGLDNWAEPKPMDANLPYAYPLTTLESAGGFVGTTIDFVRFIASIDGLGTFPDLLTTNTVRVMAADLLGWDGFLSSGGANPQTSIWGKLGVLPGVITKGIKWRNGVILAYALNSWELGADPDLMARLTSSLGSVSWPTNDLFEATLSYETWRMKHFSEAEHGDPAISGDLADPDADSQPNLLEYAQAMDPRRKNEPESLFLAPAPGERSRLAIGYRRLPLENEVEYRLESSPDMRSWSAVAGEWEESAAAPDGTVRRTYSVDLANGPGRSAGFFRLQVRRK